MAFEILYSEDTGLTPKILKDVMDDKTLLEIKVFEYKVDNNKLQEYYNAVKLGFRKIVIGSHIKQLKELLDEISSFPPESIDETNKLLISLVKEMYDIHRNLFLFKVSEPDHNRITNFFMDIQNGFDNIENLNSKEYLELCDTAKGMYDTYKLIMKGYIIAMYQLKYNGYVNN